MNNPIVKIRRLAARGSRATSPGVIAGAVAISLATAGLLLALTAPASGAATVQSTDVVTTSAPATDLNSSSSAPATDANSSSSAPATDVTTTSAPATDATSSSAPATDDTTSTAPATDVTTSGQVAGSSGAGSSSDVATLTPAVGPHLAFTGVRLIGLLMAALGLLAGGVLVLVLAGTRSASRRTH